MDLGDLTGPLYVETGSQLATPQLIQLLQAATYKFNAISSDALTLTGTTLDRELTTSESRLLVLLGIAAYIRGEWIKATQNAVVHLNVAGRTDLRTPAVEFKHLAKILADELVPLISEVAGRGGAAAAACVELGETLNLASWNWPRSPWGS